MASIQRQSSHRIVDVDTHPEYAQYAADVPSALAYPLRRGRQVIGSLSVLGKVSSNPLAGESFSPQDQALLERLGRHVEQSLKQFEQRERARHHQRYDDLTGLPNAAHLAERLDEEVARSGRRGSQLALVRLQMRGLTDLSEQHGEEQTDRLVLSIAQELRGGLREFDVLARTSTDTFEMLVPEPDAEVSGLLGPLARRVREGLRREPEAALGARLNLEFGYAVFPDEAATPRALLDLARKPRITAD